MAGHFKFEITHQEALNLVQALSVDILDRIKKEHDIGVMNSCANAKRKITAQIRKHERLNYRFERITQNP